MLWQMESAMHGPYLINQFSFAKLITPRTPSLAIVVLMSPILCKQLLVFPTLYSSAVDHTYPQAEFRGGYTLYQAPTPHQ